MLYIRLLGTCIPCEVFHMLFPPWKMLNISGRNASLAYHSTSSHGEVLNPHIPEKWTSKSVQYRLSFKGVRFRIANFASHFICVQIFQIDFPLILSASKYLRHISLSFHICRGQNEHFSIIMKEKWTS